MDIGEYSINFLLACIPASVVGLKLYFGGYVTEKGKNLATKEDIEEITETVQSVTKKHSLELDAFRSSLRERVDKQLAEHKGEIDQKVNFHKHELDKAVAEAKLKAEHTFAILPEIWHLTLHAEAEVALAFVPLDESVGSLNDAELEAFLAGTYPGVVHSGFLPLHQSLQGFTPSQRTQKVEEWLEFVRIRHAETVTEEAVGVLMSHRVLLSEPVFNPAYAALGHLTQTLKLARLHHASGALREQQNSLLRSSEAGKASESIKLLLAAIHAELDPSTGKSRLSVT